MVVNKIVIRAMQGRLLPPVDGRFQSFPVDGWKHELSLLREADIDGVEWIVDSESWEINPLLTETGRQDISHTCSDLNLIVDSVCADIFMIDKLLDDGGEIVRSSLSQLERLLHACAELDFRYMILPFVDSSRLHDSVSVGGLHRLLAQLEILASRYSVEVHLETDLPPMLIAEILCGFEPPWISMNYDIGNSASLGFSHELEFEAYGPRIRSVHVKDRALGAGSVPLGTGAADLPGVFQCLINHGYSGDLVLQTARSTPGNEVEWMKQNVQSVHELIRIAATSSGDTR